MHFEVQPNRFDGESYENGVTSDCCGKLSSIAIIVNKRICGLCHDMARAAISRIVLQRAGLEGKDVPSNP